MIKCSLTATLEINMDKATQEILADLALSGYSVIILSKTREAKAAEALRSAGIIYIDAGNEKMWIVKFGRKLGHTPSVIA